MKLDVNVTMPTMGLAGTSWNLASLDKEEPTAPLHIVWKENHDEVEMEGILKLMISMIPVENSTIPQLLDGVLKKVTFCRMAIFKQSIRIIRQMRHSRLLR